ncbi:reverse transcriptase domain-containing protein [Aeromonas veronii]
MYDQIISFDNLHSAAMRCLNGKRSSPAALRYMWNLEEHLHDTHNHLAHGSYQPGGYEEFYVFEPKQRLISAPRFSDRVVHRAIIDVLEPVIDPRFIFDSYACRKGKGAHAGASRAQRWMRIIKRNHGDVYCLKADISKCFASIDHARLKAVLRNHLTCERTLELLDVIIDSSPGPQGVGIPLGNLTSQLFANLYLNELDRYAKHDLGIRYYVRYMDDFVVLHHNKGQLHEWRARIEAFLWDSLRLTTNAKTQVFPVGPDRGRALDFLGYRIYPTHRLLRKNSIRRIRYKLRKMRLKIAAGTMTPAECWPCIQSWCAHAAHANTWGLRRSLFGRTNQKKGREQ